MIRKSLLSIFSAITFISLFVISQNALSCTRVLKVDKDHAVLVGRNMDWMQDMYTNLRVYPRGIEQIGEIDDNPVEWTSKYGSIVATAYGNMTADGFNEAGFAVHTLWLNETDYGQRDVSRPGLLAFLWIQYYLDNFATVAEAVEFSKSTNMQITKFSIPSMKKPIKVHLALEDASGDSAILEYVGGKLHIYHDKSYITMTNDPTYDKQLENLKSYKVFGGSKPLPGSGNPADRFVRGTYYTRNLPAFASTADEVAGVMSVINNTSQPYRIPDSGKPYASNTIWHTVSDLTHKVYYFQDTKIQHMMHVSLNKFNLNKGAPVMWLDLPHHPELSGDVTDKFVALD